MTKQESIYPARELQFRLGYPNNHAIQIKDGGEIHLIEGTEHYHIQWLQGGDWVSGYIPTTLVANIEFNDKWQNEHYKKIDKRAELNAAKELAAQAIASLSKI